MGSGLFLFPPLELCHYWQSGELLFKQETLFYTHRALFTVAQLEKVEMMIFQRQVDLLERKRLLGWTNRECGNALSVAPGVASSKLNGFIILTDNERRRLEIAMDEETARQEIMKRV
jgi:hypothetical protein